jgi:helix-turn-helix protein
MLRPFKKLYCDWRSRIFAELKGACLAIWLYHYLRSGKDDSSYPSLYRIAKDTGYSETTVKTARGWLRKNGWLTTISKRDSKGMYAVPVEKAVLPESTTENPEPKNPTVDTAMVGKTCRGKTRRWRSTAAVKPDSEVDSGLEVNTQKGVDTTTAVGEGAITDIDVAENLSDSSEPAAQTARGKEAASRLMAEVQKVFARCDIPLRTTASHREEAVQFAQLHSADRLLLALELWLNLSRNLSIRTPSGHYQYKTWLLHEFFASGEAQIMLDIVKLYDSVTRKVDDLVFLTHLNKNRHPLPAVTTTEAKTAIKLADKCGPEEALEKLEEMAEDAWASLSSEPAPIPQST